MSKSFIQSIDPGTCPNCYSDNTRAQRGGAYCLDCGEEWSESDANFAKSMLPENSDEAEAATYRKTLGSKPLND
jgi:uncharacterized Zn ribbon protein